MTKEQLKQTFEEKGLSLNWLSKQLNVSVTGLLRVAKKPIVGEAYDPNKINFDELYKFIERNGLVIILDKIDFNSFTKERSKKELGFELIVGSEIKMEDNEMYRVVYFNEQSVCFEHIDTKQLRAMSIKRLISLFND